MLIEPSTASALTLALYDHLLTLPDELDMMWSREWDLPRALFFLVRYGVAAFLLYLGSGEANMLFTPIYSALTVSL